MIRWKGEEDLTFPFLIFFCMQQCQCIFGISQTDLVKRTNGNANNQPHYCPATLIPPMTPYNILYLLVLFFRKFELVAISVRVPYHIAVFILLHDDHENLFF